MAGGLDEILWWCSLPGKCVKNVITPCFIFSKILGVWRDVSDLFILSSV